jgi:hypothetical protein
VVLIIPDNYTCVHVSILINIYKCDVQKLVSVHVGKVEIYWDGITPPPDKTVILSACESHMAGILLKYKKLLRLLLNTNNLENVHPITVFIAFGITFPY